MANIQIESCYVWRHYPHGSAVNLTMGSLHLVWIVYLHFFVFWHDVYAITYVLIHHIILGLYLYFLNIVLFFSSTPVLTSSIDVVFVLYCLCIDGTNIHYGYWLWMRWHTFTSSYMHNVVNPFPGKFMLGFPLSISLDINTCIATTLTTLTRWLSMIIVFNGLLVSVPSSTNLSRRVAFYLSLTV